MKKKLLNFIYQDSIKINLFANITGKIITSLISVFIVPFYIKNLGVESYGLIGIFSSITAMVSILDLGISTSLNRELAKISTSNEEQLKSRDLIYTMEVFYIVIGIMGFIILYTLVPIFQNWVHPVNLTKLTIKNSFILICFVFLTQWPSSFYTGGLTGLGKQFLLNIIQLFFVLCKSFGTILVLSYYKSSIEIFFLCQIVVNVLFFFIMRFAVWSCFPKSTKSPKFNIKLLNEIKKFTSGISLLMILSLVLTQIDKVILSKTLSLEMFGYYSLAFVITSNIGILVNAVYNSFFPRFTNLIYNNNHIELRNLYHKGCKLVSLFIFPISLMIIFFSKELLFMWNGNEIIADKTYKVLSLLVIGQVFNNLVIMPMSLQFASGWLRLSIIKNIIAVIILIPLMFYLTSKYSLIGAGICWIILNISYFFIEVPIMHKKLLSNDLTEFYIKDVLFPFIFCLIPVLIIYSLKISFTTRFQIFIFFLLMGIITTAITLLSINFLRKRMITKYFEIKRYFLFR